MTTALRQTAGTVKQALTAGQAGQIALSWLPQVILLDVRLGQNSGFDVARQIRASWPPTEPRPRIIMLSGDSAEASHPLAAEHTDGFLLKPFSARQLAAAVATRARHPEPSQASRHEPSTDCLQQLFRTELAACLGLLEDYFSAPDLAAAGAILHQLIASSALCRQQELERNLRALDAACRKNAGAEFIALEYYSLLTSARDYLGRS